MSRALRILFLVHAAVGIVVGGLLLIIPGRLLEWLQWGPAIDPIVSRLLGAAILAFAWSSLYGWRATQRSQVSILIQMEAVFTVLACVGMLRHMYRGSGWIPAAWVSLGLFAAFAIAWTFFLFVLRE